MIKLKFKICSSLLVISMGLLSLQVGAMYDPNVSYDELDGKTIRTMNLTTGVMPDRTTDESLIDSENGEDNIFLKGIVKLNELEGGFYEVDGYRLVGEYEFENYIRKIVEVTGVKDTQMGIFMTKGIKVSHIKEIILEDEIELSDDFIDEQINQDVIEDSEELISEQMILNGMIKFKDISGGFYELGGFRLTGEYDFSKYLGEVVEISGVEKNSQNQGNDGEVDIFMTRKFQVNFIEVVDRDLYKRNLLNTIQDLLISFEKINKNRNRLIQRNVEGVNQNLILENQYINSKKQTKEKLEELITLEGREVNLENYKSLGRLMEIEEDVVNVYINGNKPNFDLHARPFIEKGRTLVPFRMVAEELNCEVTWLEDERKVVIQKEDINVEITIDSNIALVNGQEVELDVEATIKNNRTYMPLRFVGESMNTQVEWVSNGNMVVMSSK